MIVDAHLHVFLDADADPTRTVDAIAPADRSAPVEDLISVMGDHGVDRAVLLPLGPETTYIESVLRDHPGRFRGICVDDPTDADVEGVLDAVQAGGFDGLRVFGLPVADESRWGRLLDGLADRDLVLWAYPRAEDVATLDAAAAARPSLRIALNHSGLVQAGIGVDDRGRPRIDAALPQATRDAVAALARHPSVVVILSGAYGFSRQPYPYADVAAHVAVIADAFGPHRLMWASDYPWPVDDPGYGRLLDLVDRHLPDLTPAERDAVMGGTCRRFLRWED